MGCTMGTGGTKNAGQHEFQARFELGKKLGAGAFGQVRYARRRDGVDVDEIPLAVKIISLKTKQIVTSSELLEDVIAEDLAWRRVGEHPNILTLYETFIGTGSTKLACFLMERCAGTLLSSNRLKMGEETTLAQFAQQMLKSIAPRRTTTDF